MKRFYFLIFILSVLNINAQEKIVGTYKNELGEKLILHSDYTFEYYWNFDLASSWNVGTWKITKNNFVYLKVNEIKDTIKSENKVELVLSSDKISNEISNRENVLNSISSGGQSRKLPPEKVLLKNNKIFTLSETGKLENKKLESVTDTRLNLKPWFEKQ